MGRRCGVCAQAPCFVHCLWCGVDCEQPDPVHGGDCPQTTGLYPGDGECCCDCGDPVGDYYALLPDGDWQRVVCLPCAVLVVTDG